VELTTVIVIMLILATLFVSAYSYLLSRADRASCISNLQNLYTAGQAYLVDHDYIWPQISNASVSDPSYAQAWVSTFQPYQLGPVNWICPTTQRALGNPNYQTPQGARVDYIGTGFSKDKYAAYQWPTHPWFAESGAGHGDGPLLVFTNGQILSVNQAAQLSSNAPQ
jgi:type II secretory pathway pseudopilin PulG